MKHLNPSLQISTLLFLAAACGSQTPPVMKTSLGQAPSSGTSDEQIAKEKEEEGAREGIQAESDARNKTDTQAESASLSLDEALRKSLAKTENLQLDSANFKVMGLRAGLEDRNGATIPFVSFLPVQDADHYQLARCESDAQISGLFDTLEETELETVNLEDERIKLIQNGFWNAIAANNKCNVLEQNLTSTIYLDTQLKTGKVKYAARACSSAGSSSAFGKRCSELVSLSPELPDFVNVVSQIAEAVNESILEEENKIQKSAVELSEKARSFAKALMTCEQQNNVRALSLQRKTILAELVSFGARIGSELVIHEFSSPLAAAQSLWAKRTVLVKETRPLANILRDVFVTEKDAQLSCYAAEKIAQDVQNILRSIEASKRTIAALRPSGTQPGPAAEQKSTNEGR